MKTSNLLLFLILSIFYACKQPVSEVPDERKGKLFIIGGGKRPAAMVNDLVNIALNDSTEYILVFPQASSEPDTSFFYARKQFIEQGCQDVRNYHFTSHVEMSDAQLDTIRKASLIYLPGGAQDRFMEVIANTPVHDALQTAYKNGATIAGTSAGAAVMSEMMITGDQFKYPEYTGYFRTIESENMELKQGLGFLKDAIVDQHFIKRMRLNRLITVILENPDKTGIGIDESTALMVDGNKGTVYGIGQVIVLRHRTKETRKQDGLLGAKGLEMEVLLPGETTYIKTR